MNRRVRRIPGCSNSSRRCVAAGLVALSILMGTGRPARAAGKLSWVDEVVRDVITETKAGARVVARETAGEPGQLAAKRAGRLFLNHDADEGLDQLVRRSDDFSRSALRVDQPSEALLQARFSRVLKKDPEVLRSFAALPASEKRLVVEMSEAAQALARRYPEQAETMVRQLGPEGLSAVRAFGDDVAEVLATEGSGGLSVLRKTGRSGWGFFTREVLPHKKKLAAAGVLATFLANPDKFVDYAGKATEYAVNEFAKAGVQLATGVAGGAARGLESTIGRSLSAYGLDFAVLRYLGMALAGLAVVVSSMVLLGLPMRWVTMPLRPVFRVLRGKGSLARISGS